MNALNIIVVALPILVTLAIFVLPRSLFCIYDKRVKLRAVKDHDSDLDRGSVRGSVNIERILKELETGEGTGRNKEGREVVAARSP